MVENDQKHSKMSKKVRKAHKEKQRKKFILGMLIFHKTNKLPRNEPKIQN